MDLICFLRASSFFLRLLFQAFQFMLNCVLVYKNWRKCILTIQFTSFILNKTVKYTCACTPYILNLTPILSIYIVVNRNNEQIKNVVNEWQYTCIMHFRSYTQTQKSWKNIFVVYCAVNKQFADVVCVLKMHRKVLVWGLNGLHTTNN